MARIRDRKWRIAFERATVERGELGRVNEKSWASLGSRWAAVYWGSGAERRAAGVEQAVQSASFNVLADSVVRTITVGDRIRLSAEGGEMVFDITAITPTGPLRGEFDFTGVASRG